MDSAQNRSALGPCGTPVRLPDVVAPRSPAITKAVGGDREISLVWASNREPDLLDYRVLRADNELDARDPRTMTQVAVVAAAANPSARPEAVTWKDTGVQGLKDFWYRVVAVDRTDADPRGGGGNVSLPSPAVRARAFDQTPPAPPPITTAEWIRLDETGAVFPFADPVPAGATREPAMRVGWADPGPGARVLLQMKTAPDAGFANVSGWLAPGVTSVVRRHDRPFETHQLRLKVVNAAGNANAVFLPTAIPPPA